MYHFIINGRIKPYVRMTQRGKFVKKNAIEYISSQEALATQFKQQMRDNGWEMLPAQTPLLVEIRISPARHNHDLDNVVKAILDALQGVAFPDDRWVDTLVAARTVGNGKEIALITVGRWPPEYWTEKGLMK